MTSSLKRKLISGFCVVALFTVLVGFVGLRAVSRVDELLVDVSTDLAPSISYAEKIHVELYRALWATSRGIDAARTKNAERGKKARAVRDDAFAKIDESIRAFDALPLSPEESEPWRELRGQMNDYATRNLAIWEAIEANDPNRASQMVDDLQRFRDAILSSSTKLIGIEQADILAEQREGAAASAGARQIIWISTLLSLVAAVAIGLTIALRCSETIIKLKAAAMRMARGDFEQTIEHEGKDELGALAESFRVTSQVLRGATNEMQGLILAARSGDLSKRADASKYSGGFAHLVSGMNDVLEAVSTPMAEASRVLEQVAQNDLTVRMQGRYAGEFDKIRVATNAALDNLEGALLEVQVVARQVSAAASEITSASSQMARGASSQAASIEEVLSSLEEITAMSKLNAANARESSSHAQSAAAMADQGSARMDRLSSAVESIKGAADETAKIIKTIDEIAFQTNLLALNAAVEAARAGDSGRGFAVVAEEVRSLAMRSAEAARNTTEVIELSLKKADEGVTINKEASVAFDAIGKQIKRVVAVMSEIAESSVQQHDSVARINKGVDSVSRETQQGAASTEQTASSAQELSAQAETMSVLTSQFRLGQRRVAESGSRVATPQLDSSPTSFDLFDEPEAIAG